MNFTDIVKTLEIPKTSVHALLKTLVNMKYLVLDKEHGYRLGLRVFELGAAVDRTRILVDAAHSVLHKGASETHCTCNLGILDGQDVYYIDKVQHSNALIQIGTRIGGRLPAYATGLGKVLLGGLDPQRIQDYLKSVELKKLGPGTITDLDTLRKNILDAKSVGFAIDDEESHANVICVAAAVRDAAGAVVAAISVTGLKSQMYSDGNYPYVPLVMEMANLITRKLR